MKIAVIISIFFSCVYAGPESTSKIEDVIANYFADDKVKSFKEEWKSHRPGIENAIELALKENFGNLGLNVFVQTDKDNLLVSDGFLIDDGVVQVLFKDMYLNQLPYIKNPRVSFPLASNVLQVEAGVTKIIIQTQYHLFRNDSDIVYTRDKKEEKLSSPFSLQQVSERGQATITAEGCVLDGFALATLQGESVHLGFGNFYIYNCQFSVEISTPELGSPPLIMPYFSEDQESQLERLIMAPLRMELMPSLQGYMLSYVNTSTLPSMPKVRHLQRSLLRKTHRYMTKVVKKLNKLTAENNAASQLWDDVDISWTTTIQGNLQTTSVKLTNLTVSGFDSVYSSHTGAPYKPGLIKLDDSLRYSDIAFRGSGMFKMNEAEHVFIFSGEIHDVISYATVLVNTVANVNEEEQSGYLEPTKDVLKFEVQGWRSLDIHGPPSQIVDTYALMTGVLINKVPGAIVEHLSKYFAEIIGRPGQDMSFSSLKKRGNKTEKAKDNDGDLPDTETNDQGDEKDTDGEDELDNGTGKDADNNGDDSPGDQKDADGPDGVDAASVQDAGNNDQYNKEHGLNTDESDSVTTQPAQGRKHYKRPRRYQKKSRKHYRISDNEIRRN